MEYVLKSVAEATRGEISHYCLVASKKGPSRVESSPGIQVHYLRERGTLLLSPVLPSLPSVLIGLRRKGIFPVILLHYPNPTAVLALVLSFPFCRKREKIAIWYHADMLLRERWKRALYSIFRPIEHFLFRRTDAFLAATPHHVRLSSVLCRYRDRTTIIPFAVPDDWFSITDEEAIAGRSAREKIGGKYILFVGRFVPYKGLDTLVNAAEAIKCPIALVGAGPLEGYLRREISARGLQAKIHLLGNVEDVRPWYIGCEFLVLPSSSELEAFGIVQIEAMGLGKPVISSDLETGVTYVNRNGETGFTFPAGDAEAFAAACNRLLDDDALRRELGSAARERTRREFSYSAIGEKLVRFFREIKT
jgi:rhamnosyl/mannosyltransferase